MIGRLVLFLATTLAAIGSAHAQFGAFDERLLDRAKEKMESAFKAELSAVGPCLSSASADSPSDCMEAAFAASITSSLGGMLRGEALELHQGALLSALTSGEDASWTADEGKVSGEVKVVENVQLEESVDISIDSSRAEQPPAAIDLIGKDYHAIGKLEVRKGPGTSRPVTGVLSAGETLTAIGKLRDGNWYLVGRNGVAIGYVDGKGLAEGAGEPAARAETAPDSTVETASVDANRPCRTVEQIVKDINGREKTETIRACMGPNGWELS